MNKFTYASLVSILACISSVNAGTYTPVKDAYIGPFVEDNGGIKSALLKSIRFENEALFEGRYAIYDEKSLLESTNFAWQQEDSYWTIGNGQSDNKRSGPISGKYGWGNYVYFDTSAGNANIKGDSAYFYLPLNYNIDEFYPDKIEGAYITFDYHMFGKNTGRLSVEAYDMNRKKWITVWSQKGQKQRSASAPWKSASVSLAKVAFNGNIRIKGTARGGINGEIAFDDFQLHSTATKKHVFITGMNSYQDAYDVNYFVNWGLSYGYNEYTFFTLATNKNTLEEKVISEYFILGPYNTGYKGFTYDEMCQSLGGGEWEVGFQVWSFKDPSTASQTPAEFNYHFDCQY